MKNSIKPQNFKALLLILIAPIFIACSDSGTNPLDFNIFPLSEDANLGAQLDAELKADPNFRLVDNAAAQAYVNDIMNQVLQSDEIKYRDEFNYTIQIVDDPNTVNAFAAPGGYMYFYTGLINFLDDEATFAGIVAHEIAHIEKRHSTKRLTTMYGVQILTSIVLGQDPSALEEIAAGLFTGLGMLKYSRVDEYEADEYSFRYLMDTKWYPGGTKAFFEKVGQNREASFLETWLSTHPAPEDRIEQINELMQEYGISGPNNNLYPESYAQFKALF